jgi:DNA-binding response OmpR family regulator
LVVEDDVALRSSICRDLEADGFDVTQAADVRSAIEALAGRSFDVMLTDLRLESGSSGMDLLEELPRISSATRSILMSGYATGRDHRHATDLGAVEILYKPFSPADLREAVARAIDSSSGFRGQVHGLSLIDFLQVLHVARRSVTVDVSTDRPTAVHLHEGEVVHARYGRQEGRDALRHILGLSGGSIRTSPLKSSARTLSERFDSLLLDCLRLNDEGRGGDTEAVPEDDFDFFDDEEATPNPESKDIGKEEEADMGAIDDQCKKVVDGADGAVACGVIDLDTGMILGIYNRAQYTQTLNEIVAAAAMDLFRGNAVSRIEKMVREARGVPEDGSHYLDEVHMTSAQNYHFCKTIKKGRAAIVLVTNRSTNIGMGWAQLKSVIADVEPHVP